MEGKDLIETLLDRIYTRNGVVSDPFLDSLLDNNVLDAASHLKSIVSNPYLVSFLERIESIIASNPDSFLTTPYSNTGTACIIDFSTGSLEGRNRDFFYSDIHVGFASTLSFFEAGKFVDFSTANKLLLWKQLEYFIERTIANGDSPSLELLFQVIENGDRMKGILVNKSSVSADVKRIYGYIYLCLLNFGNRLSMDSQLISNNRTINGSLALNSAVTYEQYLDVFDVLNEVNHASDIVGRFLKIYHVLEYLAYRVALSNIVSNVAQSKSFIRKVIQLSDGIRKNEGEQFVNSFVKLFAGKEALFHAKISSIANPASMSAIESWWMPGYQSDNLKKNAGLIYSIRNSIVHNKESEFHISISNPDEYKIVIPVIKKLMEVLEELIVEKMSTNEPLIQYSRSQLDLF